ncbi:MAG TPA: ABC transporter ATP-binding protein/permease [Methylomirabilota bacterium]|jgi:putative ATP-binding cassette transporter
MGRFDRLFWTRLWALTRPYWVSDQSFVALGILTFIFLLNGTIQVGNVVFSYVTRDMMTALADRDAPTFFHKMLLLVAYNVVAAPIIAVAGYVTGELMLRWRRWLTEWFLEHSFQDRAFYRISHDADIDNPDQRVSEDLATFTSSTLSFVMQILQGLATGAAFITVLWFISPLLVLVLAACVGVGSLLTIVIGRPLIAINFEQRRREADFRYALVGLRDHAEAVALYGGERREHRTLLQRLYAAMTTFHRLLVAQRNLAFFTYAYDLLLPLVPFVVLAPSFFAGTIEFGKITQAGAAFATLRTALSLIIDQFTSFSSFAAVVERLGTYREASERGPGPPVPAAAEAAAGSDPRIEIVEAPRLALERLTLTTPDEAKTLIRDLSLEGANGAGLLIVGATGAGKTSLLRAIAGLWRSGSGRILRPPLAEMIFLPQRPYLIPGSLRDQLCYPREGDASDEQMIALLERVGLQDLLERVGGLDAHANWENLLTLSEQQQIALARLLFNRPTLAFLDEATSALDEGTEQALYERLAAAHIAVVSVGDRRRLARYHRVVLELLGHGDWRLATLGPGGVNGALDPVARTGDP